MYQQFNSSRNTILYVHMIRQARRCNRRKGDGRYYERHHVLPKCIGGSNDQSNLILLTAEEHLRAHWLLPEMVVDESHRHKMACALHLMMYSSSYQKRVGAIQFYAVAKRKMSESMSAAMKGKKGRKGGTWTGRKHTSESKAKISAANIGENNPMFGYAPIMGESHPKFVGYYRTPWGRFETSRGAAKAINDLMSHVIIQKRCRNPDKTISRASYASNTHFNTTYDESVIGKTWRDLGFSFEPK